MKRTILPFLSLLLLTVAAFPQQAKQKYKSPPGRSITSNLEIWLYDSDIFNFDINNNGAPEISLNISASPGDDQPPPGAIQSADPDTIVLIDGQTRERLWQYPLPFAVSPENRVDLVGIFDFKDNGNLGALLAVCRGDTVEGPGQDTCAVRIINLENNETEFAINGVQLVTVADVDGEGGPEIILGKPDKRDVRVIGYDGGNNSVSKSGAHFSIRTTLADYNLVLKYESDPDQSLAFDGRRLRRNRDLDIDGDDVVDIAMLVEDNNGDPVGMEVVDGASQQIKWQYAFPQEQLNAILEGFRGFHDVNGDGQKEAYFGDNIAVTLDKELHVVDENFRLRAIFDIDDDGFPELIGESVVDTTVQVWGKATTTGVSDEDLIIAGFQLQQNYPNPFNPSTTIPYSVERAGQIELNIYDLLGRKVRSLVQQSKIAGEYSVVWNGKDDFGRQVASGHYFYQLKVGDFLSTRRMILLK